MPLHLGSEKAWRTRRLSGDLVASYEWLDGEPCLFLYPAGKQTGGAMAIPLAVAHAWAGSDGHPNLEHALPSAYQAAEAMGLDPTPQTIRQIVDAVVEGLPDLIEMPPMMTQETEISGPAIGEASIILDGETSHEREIRA